MDSETQKRLEMMLPEIFESKSVMYIGIHPGGFTFNEGFSHGNMCVLEAHEPNVRWASATYPDLGGVFLGDVRNISSSPILELAPFDCVIWWHGPEHTSREDCERLLGEGGELEACWSRGILLGCPNGPYWKPERHYSDNPYEEHVSALSGRFLSDLGYYPLIMGPETDNPEYPDRTGQLLAAYRVSDGFQ